MSAQEQGADAVEGRWLTIPRSLCFVCHGEDLLLMKRAATRRVFPNRYNGVGGHIERDEDPLSSARREIREETGLEVNNLRLRAVYNIDAGAATGIILFVFTGTSTSRDFVSDEREGTLHWIARSRLAELDLVDDLPLILPRILDQPAHAAPLFAHISYDSEDELVMRFASEGETAK